MLPTYLYAIEWRILDSLQKYNIKRVSSIEGTALMLVALNAGTSAKTTRIDGFAVLFARLPSHLAR